MDIRELIFDESLLRLWRTEAFEEVYTVEEDGDVDVSPLIDFRG